MLHAFQIHIYHTISSGNSPIVPEGSSQEDVEWDGLQDAPMKLVLKPDVHYTPPSSPAQDSLHPQPTPLLASMAHPAEGPRPSFLRITSFGL